MMNEIVVYVRNKEINPSGYYRIYQYFSKMNKKIVYRELAKNNVYIKYHFNNKLFDKIRYIVAIFFRSLLFLIWDNLFIPKILVVNREICPKKISPIHYILEKRLLRKTYVIWDFDDDILEGKEISKREWQLLMKESDKIVLLSDILKKKIDLCYKNKVYILDTTDGDYIYSKSDNNKRMNKYRDELRLIWIATASNIKYLDIIYEELENAALELMEKYKKKLVLVCVCNAQVKYSAINFRIENIVWTRENAIKEMKKAHIGIMPLIDNEYTRGKGGFKIIQYMSAGLPVIASGVGYNNFIIKKEFGYIAKSWKEAILDIGADYNKWAEFSENSYKEWKEKFSYEKHFYFWDLILNEKY